MFKNILNHLSTLCDYFYKRDLGIVYTFFHVQDSKKFQVSR